MRLSSKQVCNDDDLSKSLLDLPNCPSTTKEEEKVQQLEGIDCPRCGSKKTKFCYYNNYNKSQPRHFCKGCKRHWTKGGTLRKVPVGGGRKNKRLKITPPYSASSNASSTAAVPKAYSTTNSMNILMNHEFHLGPHQGLKDMTDDEKNISHIQFETFIDDGNHRSFTFSGLDSSFQFDGNIIPSNYTTSSSNAVFSPVWQSGGVVDSMQNCWNLNDLDALISADLNVPWPDDDDDDAAQINPGPSI